MNTYKIFPAIGIARVGNAPEKFYIDPEAYRGLPINPDDKPFEESDFRDENGRICRQAARFRIFRTNDKGVTEEVNLSTEGIKSIKWNVHLANKKSSWYQFATSEGETGYTPNHPLRNPHVKDRHQLIIDAGPRTIGGKSCSGVHFSSNTVPEDYEGANFPKGKLNPTKEAIETLGELRTDSQGRLLVLGGMGISGTTDKDVVIVDYANNNNWWDDTSDGPVGAQIELMTGEVIDVTPAHVLVAPPKYAPEIANLVTLYDTIFNAMVKDNRYPEIFENGFWKSGKKGYKPCFQTDIQPLLERGTCYPWVAAIPPKPHSFDFDMLGKTGPDGYGVEEYRGVRKYILDFLRPPQQENNLLASNGATMMPYLAGDNCLISEIPMSNYLRLTDTQYFMLQQWSEGWFTTIPPKENKPDMLTRVALENCVGGAFSPGIEMTWISRNPQIYTTDEPFRIRAYFPENGPLSLGFDPQRGMEPGDLTRYMAVPWQADFNECSSQPIGDRILWWWPSQRPEYVYLDPTNKKLKALFADAPQELKSLKQVAWIGNDFDQLAGNYISFANDVDMVRYWAGLGFIIGKEIEGETRYVEVERTLPRPFIPANE